MKKVFSIVSVLAVIAIVVLAVIKVMPQFTDSVGSVHKAMKTNAQEILTALESEQLDDETFNPTTVNETNIKSLLKIENDNYKSITVKTINKKLYITIEGKNKWDGYTVSATKDISNVIDTITNLKGGANAPLLVTGMTPIKWNGEKWIETTKNDPEWYNYDTTNKKWANATTTDGSMWIWIPRFIYKITTNWHTNVAGTIEIQFTKGIDDNWNKANIGVINPIENANASNNKWTNHPAFTFGDNELTGFWVPKFEASGTSAAINFKPNTVSIREMTVSDIFDVTRDMETNNRYGWGTTGAGIDTHLMKNIEWGAVAYLSKSAYGSYTEEVWINPADDYTSGCAGDSVSSSYTEGCLHTYETTNGVKTSTTGNIYGIYDMSGGTSEYVAAYIDNAENNLAAYGQSLLDAELKYKDVYKVGTTDNWTINYAVNPNKGDAIYETSSNATLTVDNSWYNDSSTMPYGNVQWFTRGNSWYNKTSSGLFSFIYNNGDANTIETFRAVLLVGNDL